jgi:16S rRNA (uracil1498-N3)-methyltransferase
LTQHQHAPSVTTSAMSVRTLLVPSPLREGDLLVTGDEAHHARSVLRLESGDEVRLADGAGASAEAVIIAVTKHGVQVRAQSLLLQDDGPAALLTVAVAPPKGDRWGDLVRQLTELGVGAILPLATARGERMPSNPERTARIAAEALKQCRRAHLPRLGPATDIPALVHSGATLTVLDRSGSPAAPGTVRPLTLVIGPEGGFTTDELARLQAAGATTVRLASPVLRIETAALAAAAVWSAAWMKETRD